MVSLAQERSRVEGARQRLTERGVLILEPEDLISRALRISKTPAVAFSGGKASLVVLDMALKYKPDILTIFNNTGVEHPDTVNFVHRLKDEWDLNLVETEPLKTYWQCVDDYGFPRIRNASDSKAIQGKKINESAPMCCKFLKERPAIRSYKQLGVDTVFTGIQAGESRVRFFNAYQKSPYYYSVKWKIFKCHPLTFWADKEVWNYIRVNGLPYNPLYDKGYDRVGCMPCTGYIGWQKSIARTNPKLLKLILEKQGQPGLDNWLRIRYQQPPCGGGARLT